MGLMSGELAILETHSAGRYDDPVLRFPFSLAELLCLPRPPWASPLRGIGLRGLPVCPRGGAFSPHEKGGWKRR
jgi:hypothetical protein